MPTVFGIPLIGLIQMLIGAAIVLFVLIKFPGRPKNKKGSFIIKNVHIITGDGTEAFNQNVYVSKDTLIKAWRIKYGFAQNSLCYILKFLQAQNPTREIAHLNVSNLI